MLETQVRHSVLQHQEMQGRHQVQQFVKVLGIRRYIGRRVVRGIESTSQAA